MQNTFAHNLRMQVESNPIAAIAVGAGLVLVSSRFMDANTTRHNANTHAKEIARRLAKVGK